jgi:hypothetical protein
MHPCASFRDGDPESIRAGGLRVRIHNIQNPYHPNPDSLNYDEFAPGLWDDTKLLSSSIAKNQSKNGDWLAHSSVPVPAFRGVHGHTNHQKYQQCIVVTTALLRNS